MTLTAIKEYYSSNIHKPFFSVVGNDEYRDLKINLEELGIDFIRLSDCCHAQDKKPDLDILREKLRTADIDCKSNRVAVLGLGEYLLLCGDRIARMVLDELKDFNLGGAWVVFLLRGGQEVVRNIATEDPTRYDNRRYFISSDVNAVEFNISISPMSISLYGICGIKALLYEFEEGVIGNINCNSDVQFPDAKCGVRIVKDSYEAVRSLYSWFKIPKSKGSEERWDYLLTQVTEHRAITDVFETLQFSEDVETGFYSKISGTSGRCWLYYLFLLTIESHIKIEYLRYCLDISQDFECFKYNILNAIIDISHNDTRFNTFYIERKQLVRDFPEAEIAQFVVNNRKDISESIYKLTDNTNVERQEIITYISKCGVPINLESIYPDLKMYLAKYYFQGDTLSTELTEYFEEYKMQKISNKIGEIFLQKVDRYALSREYNRLRTRDELVSNYANQDAFLCWIDALGVEYLSFIVEGAKRRGLIVSVKIGRSNLPTITTINNQFFYDWPEEARIKIEELDEVKHKEKGGYKYGPSNIYPIHLARELEIISDALDRAATELTLRHYEKYIIASDHGASRLAVIRKKEEKYDTDTKGKHSGRCCKLFENYELPFATEENDFVVLADYGRFKGSRTANVEVHGGASLEEVIVPVIELSLADSSIQILLADEDVISDFKTGSVIYLYVNKQLSQELIVQVEGERYKAHRVDENHYQVEITAMKRAKKYEANIYVGENLISKIEIMTRGKSASMNSDFDDLF